MNKKDLPEMSLVSFHQTKDGYKACVILMFITASCVVILNIMALIFIVTKQRKKMQNHQKYSTGAKRNEMILTSLCVANVLLGVGVLADSACYVNGQELWAGAYMIGFGLITSLIHIGMLTLERFIAVKFPFKYKEINPKFVIATSIIVWLLSVLPALTIRYNFNLFLIVLFSLLLVSNVVITCVYSYIIFHIRCSNQSKHKSKLSPGQPSASLWYSKEQKEQQNKVTAFCFSIVISYVVSTMPSVIWYLTHYEQSFTPYSGSVIGSLLFILLISRSLADPMIYIFRERIHKKFTYLHSKFALKSEKISSTISSTGEVEEMKPCMEEEKFEP
ncbi:melanocyte-stimulating hormone receptor-like [Clytia hemisphaerica]|uniref:G-protein coupled receptors family 1 profile domain-containing protein n=1 Tax=Clytia hemisphaerica TaxID=252671 RepID=A0A7M5WWG9_9CNID